MSLLIFSRECESFRQTQTHNTLHKYTHTRTHTHTHITHYTLHTLHTTHYTHTHTHKLHKHTHTRMHMDTHPHVLYTVWKINRCIIVESTEIRFRAVELIQWVLCTYILLATIIRK